MRRGALIGCGFFARNHLHAWRELEGVEIVALCDRDLSRAQGYAAEFRGQAFDDPKAMLEATQPDFVDIVTQVDTHLELVKLAASLGIPVICQKPLAQSLEDASAMVTACQKAGVRFMVHENFRWQHPMRQVKQATQNIGRLHFGRIQYRTPHDVYANQPYLATDQRFILADVGVHLLDLLRFFMGEVAELYCLTQRINPRIQGEDVATLLLKTRDGASGLIELSFASKLEEDLFPQTLLHLEGARGSVTLGPHYALTVVEDSQATFRSGLAAVCHTSAIPPLTAWAHPPAHAVQHSVLEIQRHWLECLDSGSEPETSGADNLKTLELVFGAYESAASGRIFYPKGRGRCRGLEHLK